MNTNDYTIRLEKAEDYRKVENLVRESFWNVYRPGCSEHFVIHVLRDDPAFVKELDFVMEQNGKLIGQNMFMRTVIEADDGRVIPVLTMGPIGITPELKRQGYGKKLLDYCLEKAGQHRLLRSLRFFLCPKLRHPLSRSSGGRGRLLLPLQRADPRLFGQCHRRVPDAQRLLCGRCGRGGIRQDIPSQGETETPGADF